MQWKKCIALTLALSTKRGNRSLPRWEKSLIGDRSTDLEKLLPLPGGEGRGEGERFISLNSYG